MKLHRTKIVSGALLLIADFLLTFLSAVLSYRITHGVFSFSAPTLIWAGANATAIVLLCLAFRLYTIVFATVNIFDLIRLCTALGVLSVLNLVYSVVFGNGFGVDLNTVLVFVLATSFFAGVTRLAKRMYVTIAHRLHKQHVQQKRVMIVGGGDAGVSIMKEMMTSEKVAYHPVCIVDDAEEFQGKRICEVKVVGKTDEVKEFARIYDVDEIFITMPSVKKSILKTIIDRCNESGKPVKILPGMYQFVSGQVSVTNLRKVEVQDLLGREEISVNLDEIMGYIEKKTVLVTGGGGSIGSELCRQIASHNPRRLIILDIYENNAYDIEQELKRKYPRLDLVTLIASVRDLGKMEKVFSEYRPQIVFNAAAHKHVPLMETSPNEAVKNNVFGTLNVARCADKFGVETFVQISTDKAVNPTNIMGATKRICEMIIQTIGRNSQNTKFVAVRFGNVLGSNGSVIPLFKRQIEEGGPITLTHKDIIRYFMTIPEAVSLVLQAGAYAKNGQIFVLDMGDPVKIYDLACNLIRLSGLEPHSDIEIVCTGLRPGEKLFEERLMSEEGLQKTPNGLINIAKPIPVDETAFWATLDNLFKEAYAETEDMKTLVQTLVPTYEIKNN